MRVIFDREEYIGCGSCVELCPEVFRLDKEAEKAVVILPEGDPKECIEEAIETCQCPASIGGNNQKRKDNEKRSIPGKDGD